MSIQRDGFRSTLEIRPRGVISTKSQVLLEKHSIKDEDWR
jgi:hypothetical protein